MKTDVYLEKNLKTPKLIAIDLDGTLLNSEYEISSQDLKTLRKLNDIGIKIIPATGRRFSSAIPYVEKIPCDSLVILQNGALIIDKNSRDIFFHSEIDKDVLESIVDFNKRFSLFPVYISSFRVGGRIFLMDNLKKYKILNKYLSKNVGDIEIFYESDKIKKIQVSQIMYFGRVSEMRNLFEKLTEGYFGYISLALTEYKDRDLSILDVMRKDVSKGKALKMVRKFYNIEKERVWAIGDNVNDIDMFRESFLSMAVANSSQIVKKEASVVIPDNNCSGVSFGLKKFLRGGILW